MYIKVLQQDIESNNLVWTKSFADSLLREVSEHTQTHPYLPLILGGSYSCASTDV